MKCSLPLFSLDCFENLNFQFVHQLHHHLHNRRDLDDLHELLAHQVNLGNEKQFNFLESVDFLVLQQALVQDRGGREGQKLFIFA